MLSTDELHAVRGLMWRHQMSELAPSIGAMTEETNKALKQATEAVSTARLKAEREKVACLAQIAADLPGRAAEAAKRVALDQPDVTRSLGKDGVAAVRSELQTAAEELGEKFIAAVDEIKWPVGKVDSRHVHSALFDRFWKKTGALSKVLSALGYKL